jgi:hypothetical protein
MVGTVSLDALVVGRAIPRLRLRAALGPGGRLPGLLQSLYQRKEVVRLSDMLDGTLEVRGR